MSSRDIFADVAAILHPIPRPGPGDEDHDGFLVLRDEVVAEQHRTAQQLQDGWVHADQDPLIHALAWARKSKEEAEQRIRELLAYGREFIQPRPYTLGDLAGAAGMSISGVRTAYGHRDVDAVATATGAKPREWRTPDPDPAGEDQVPA